MVLPLAALAQSPPYFYSCTVFQDGALAGAGKVVKAYVGTESTPREGATATTNASGVAVLQVERGAGDFGPPVKTVRFTVNDVNATETPDVSITAVATVRLDVSTVPVFNPWDYDDNPDDGVMSKAEAIIAVNDYFDGIITKDQALQVVNLYFD
jgi:hypothetical protein